MVPEPFTILASSLGILGALFTAMTVVAATVYETKHRWQSYSWAVDTLLQEIRISEQRLRALQQRWNLHVDRKIEDYEYLFGRDFNNELQVMRTGIHKYMSAASVSLKREKAILPETSADCSLDDLHRWLNKVKDQKEKLERSA